MPGTSSLEARKAAAREAALKQLAEMSDEEDRAITENALADPDSPPLDESFARRGRPIADSPKKQVTMRLDADIIETLRKGGRGWQTRANALLRDALGLE